MLAGLALLDAQPASAAPLTAFREAELLATDRATNDEGGTSVAISADGSYAIFGAPGEGGSGAAYVFVRTGTSWTQQAKLLPSLGGPSARFGAAVAISADGSRVLVGRPGPDADGTGDSGAAYVFVRTGASWGQEAWLQNFVASDVFGASVALSADGSIALVGAPRDDPPGMSTGDQGSFTAFVRSGSSWSGGAPRFTSDAGANDACGTSLSISSDGSIAMMGCPLHDDMASDSGSVYFFTRSGTTWTELVQQSGSVASQHYGAAVALSGDARWALAGAPTTGGGLGTVYALSWTGATFTPSVSLMASGTGLPDRFGWSVALSGDGARAVVGSCASAMFGGAAFAFQRVGTTWAQEARLDAPSPQTGDSMSQSVGISTDGARAISGIPFLDDSGTNTGGAWVFGLTSDPGTSCVDDSYCTSGFCVEGICCDLACGRGAADDCQSCRAVLNGGADGTCGGLSSSVAPTVTCRPSGGACDTAETCVVGDATCPTDVLSSASTECRAAIGDCDAPELCTGSSAACPANMLFPLGHACRAAAGPCDAPEACDGITADCPANVLRPAGYVCAPSTGELCDADDVCTGDSATCPPRYLAGVVCRASMGGCDIAESCAGASTSCPPDQTSPVGTVCRSSVDLVCDPLESCDGVSPACPLDVNACVRDGAVPDGGARLDAGVDASTAPVPTAGCSCRLAARPDASARGLACLVVAALLLARRRR